MKIFLTGGTGFIGSYLLRDLINDEHEVVALKRKGSSPHLKLSREPEWVEGSLDGDYIKYMESVDVFIHLASHTANHPYDSLENLLYWNVYASIKLAKQAIEAGVKNFLVAGTCFEYGKAGEKKGIIDKNCSLEPTLSYPISKAAASIAFEGLSREHNIKLKLLRIFQVFGEGESEKRLWPSLKKAAFEGKDFPMTKGEQLRDFVNVEDVSKTFMNSLNFNDVDELKPFVGHVATGKPQTLLEFSQHWWNLWEAKGSLLPGHVEYRKNESMKIISAPEDIVY